MRKHLVLTASGRDRPGIVERFTSAIIEAEGNVEASRMARLGGEFAILMLVSAPEESLQRLQESAARLREESFDVHTRLTDCAEAEVISSSTPCGITVMGADHMGIIHDVARFLAGQGINVETMDTDVVAAPMSGSPLFTMSAVVRLPPGMSVDQLREALDEIGEDVGVGTAVQPRVAPLES
jgi:glycine cleavage system transcriptional repressor